MDISKNMCNFNSMDNNKIMDGNSNIVIILLIMNYFIIFLLFYKYNFYEKQQINTKDEIELLNKKYLYCDECFKKCSNNISEEINVIILNIKYNNNLLNEKILNIEKCLNNEILSIKKEIQK